MFGPFVVAVNFDKCNCISFLFIIILLILFACMIFSTVPLFSCDFWNFLSCCSSKIRLSSAADTRLLVVLPRLVLVDVFVVYFFNGVLDADRVNFKAILIAMMGFVYMIRRMVREVRYDVDCCILLIVRWEGKFSRKEVGVKAFMILCFLFVYFLLWPPYQITTAWHITNLAKTLYSRIVRLNWLEFGS